MAHLPQQPKWSQSFCLYWEGIFRGLFVFVCVCVCVCALRVMSCVPLLLDFCFPFGCLGVLFSLSILALFGGGAEPSLSLSFSDLVPDARTCVKQIL